MNFRVDINFQVIQISY